MQGSDPILSGATGRLWLSARHRLRLELQSDNGRMPRSSSTTAPSGSTTRPRTRSTRARCRGRGQAGTQGHEQGIPSIAADPEASDRARAARQPDRRDPGRRRRAGGLHGPRLAQARRRPARRRRARLGRDQGRPAAVRRLRARTRQLAGARAEGDRHLLRQGAGRRSFKVVAAVGRQDRPGRHAGKAHANAKPAASARRTAGTATSPAPQPSPRSCRSRSSRPTTLVGLPRRVVSLLDWGGHPGRAGLLRAEPRRRRGDRAAAHGQAPRRRRSASGGDHRGLSLPTVSINGATGQELDTALGTVVRFTRGGVAYTVLGSVPGGRGRRGGARAVTPTRCRRRRRSRSAAWSSATAS